MTVSVHAQVLGQHAEAEALRDEARQELSSTRQRMEETAAEAADERQQLQTQIVALKTSLTETEGELSRECASGQASASKVAELEQALGRLKRRFSAELDKAREEMETVKTGRLREAREWEERMEALRTELRGAAEREMQSVEKGEREAARAKAELRVSVAPLSSAGGVKDGLCRRCKLKWKE
jgi:chromosome segregation ATPase